HDLSGRADYRERVWRAADGVRAVWGVLGDRAAQPPPGDADVRLLQIASAAWSASSLRSGPTTARFNKGSRNSCCASDRISSGVTASICCTISSTLSASSFKTSCTPNQLALAYESSMR